MRLIESQAKKPNSHVFVPYPQFRGISAVSDRVQYEFEGFRLDTFTQSLISIGDEKQIPLKPKEFEVLQYFVVHAGELLDKETLLNAFWPGQTVEENNLNQYVTALRKYLGEERGGRRFILNVRARGYRFIPEVICLNTKSEVRSTHSDVIESMPPTSNKVAWQCYQHAVSLKNDEKPDRWCEAITLLERAVELDPNFGSAYAHLALTRILLFILDYPGSSEMLQQAERESRLAVKLRPGSAEGYMALGAIEAACGRWVEAELNFLASRKLDSEWLLTINTHSVNVLLSVGHIQRALKIARETLDDVGGFTSLATLQAVVCLLANENEEGQQALELAVAMGADSTITPMADILSLQAQRNRMFERAGDALIPSLPSTLIAANGDAVVRTMFAALEHFELRPKAIFEIERLVDSVGLDVLPQAMCRQVLLWYTQLGGLDNAFEFANRILDKYQPYGSVGTAWGSLWLDEMKAFRLDARFSKFAKRMQLPDYWNAFGPPDGHLWKDNRLVEL